MSGETQQALKGMNLVQSSFVWIKRKEVPEVETT